MQIPIIPILIGLTADIGRRKLANLQQFVFISLLAGCSFGPNYDNPVRELSLKLEDLSKYEAKEGVTINDMKRKLDIYSKEIDLAASKIEAGGEKEKVVRAYYSAAVDYLDGKAKYISTLGASSALVDRAEKLDAPDCSRYSTLAGASACAIRAGGEMQQLARDLEQAESKLATSTASLKKLTVALGEARNNAHSVVSKQSTVSMEHFDKLLDRENADRQARKAQEDKAAAAAAFTDTEADKRNDMPLAELIAQGRLIYEQSCAACHKSDGTGAGPIKRLAGSPMLISTDLEPALKIIVHGSVNRAMPAWGGSLTNTEIAAVATFAANSWSNNTRNSVQPSLVSKVRNARGGTGT